MKKYMKNGLLALFIGLVFLSGCESKKDTIHIATKPMSSERCLPYSLKKTPICT